MFSADRANRRYFKQAYQTGVHGWENEPSVYALNFLDRLKNLVAGGKLLDVGCGEGRHSIAAAGLGFKVTGIDFEPLALKRARKNAKTCGTAGVSFRKADVLSLPFRDNSFDVVLDYGCLHHQKKSDWGAYRKNLLRMLSPQGFYILSVFSSKFRFFRGTGRTWHVAYGAYRRCFTSRDIRQLFGSDFDILELLEERGPNGGFLHVLMKRN